MHFKIRLLFILLLFTICNFHSEGQNNDPFKMPTIIPSSPEANGLGRYGDIPVSAYTGTPDITIPIYTVKLGKLTLPISLSYHATGIDVSQESSWVGLGWNIIAGGNISYITVNGHDDSPYRLDWDKFSNFLDYLSHSYPNMSNEDGEAGWDCSTEQDTQRVTTSVARALTLGIEEQDVLSANFINYSFKFIKSPKDDSTYIFLGQKNKCLIKRKLGDFGFLIIGEDGTIYHFNCTENRSPYTLSWYLTKIVSATGDTISLKYKNASVRGLPVLSERYTIYGGDKRPVRDISGDMTTTTNQYLDTIETRNELIVFETNNERIDLDGSLKLSKIKIIDKFNQTEKLSYQFKYDYFTGSGVGGDYLNDDSNSSSRFTDYTSDNRSKRLRLDTLKIGATSARNKYVFKYYDQISLPNKTSFAMDHWGNYNGQANNSSIICSTCSRTIIPNALSLTLANPMWGSDIPSEFYFESANRGASSTYITAGLLKSVQYPTKGKTVFEYEPHNFSNYKYISAEDEIDYVPNKSASVYFLKDSPAYSVYEDAFSLNHRVAVQLHGYIKSEYSDASISIEGPAGFSTLIYNYSGPGNREWTENIWLDPGAYNLKCTVPSNPGCAISTPVNAQINYKDFDGGILASLDYIGGGVRVKNIKNYDENDNLILSKRYSYINEDGKTSGALLVPMRDIDYKVYKEGHFEQLNNYAYKIDRPTWNLYANSYVSISALPSGNNVGYNRVAIETISGSKNDGKEILYFSNSPAGFYFNKIPYFAGDANGDLLKKVLINSDGDTVLVERNNYSILSGTETVEVLNAYADDLYSGPTDVCLGLGYNPLAFVGRFDIYSYPTRNYRSTLTSQETTNYFSNKKVKKINELTYNPDNFCIRSTRESSSILSRNKYTYIKYPPDYSGNSTLDSMVLKNLLNIPIEKSEYVDSTNRFKILTNYSLQNNSFYSPFKISSSKGNSSYEERIVFDKYDYYGNLIEAHQTGNIKESYFYGYNNCFPVVKGVNIDNITLNSIVQQALTASGYTNIDDLLKSIVSFPNAAWLKFNDSLRYNHSDYMLSTYTYDPVYGLRSSTDANGVTTYYEYDDFGRLQNVKDNNGNILKAYKYHYSDR